MADITITIPNAVLSRVLDAVSVRFGYNAATDGTKAAFAKKQLIIWVKDIVRSHEGSAAGAAAQQAASESVDADITIT